MKIINSDAVKTEEKDTASYYMKFVVTAAAVGTAAGLLGTAGSAWAAGTGYGPPVVITKGVAQGFGGIMTAVTINRSGKVIHLKNAHGANITLHIGGCRNNFQAIVTDASIKAIDKSHYKSIPKSALHDHVLYSIGVLFQSGTREISSCKIDRLDIYGKTFTKKDYVLYYNSHFRAFSSAPKYHASVSQSHVIAKFRTDTEIVVLGPNTPQPHTQKKGK